MSKNAAQIRDILRGQFDAESSRASDPSVAALFAELARTADDIPDVLADAYSELFDDLYSSEIEMKMTWQMGRLSSCAPWSTWRAFETKSAYGL